MKSIYLTGFMGAGKTTAGRVLGQAMELPVYDTDQEIEKQQRRTITDIFAEQGEEAFREMESRMLQELPREDSIITTGGGIILKEENRRFLAAQGYWVYLHCEPEEIAERLAHDETRPLLSGERKKDLHRIFNERLPLYSQSGIVVDTTGKDLDEIVDTITKRIKDIEMGHTG